MAGSRWTAESDRDYYDPLDQQVLCATRGCRNPITFPAFEVLCTSCILMHQDQERIANAVVTAQRLKGRPA